MLHRKPQSLRKKTHVWLLKTYLFFLGGSKILKIKGSFIEMSLLFWCCLTLQNLCIIKLFILWYPLHPIPLSSLTSLSWNIPIIHVWAFVTGSIPIYRSWRYMYMRSEIWYLFMGVPRVDEATGLWIPLVFSLDRIMSVRSCSLSALSVEISKSSQILSLLCNHV